MPVGQFAEGGLGFSVVTAPSHSTLELVGCTQIFQVSRFRKGSRKTGQRTGSTLALQQYLWVGKRDSNEGAKEL